RRWRLREKRNDRYALLRRGGGPCNLRAIEDRQQAILVRGGNDPLPGSRGREDRHAVDIPVMAVVLDELVVAEHASAGRIDRDHRIRVQILSGTIERVEVRSGIARGNVKDVVPLVE